MKTIMLFVFLILAVSGGTAISSAYASSGECEHYFITELIGQQHILVEYDCDGKIVNMIPIGE